MPAFVVSLFWISFLIVFYTYAGYPLLLLLLTRIKKLFQKERLQSDNQPLQPATLIIAAYNEEDIIEDKIKNTLELDYPQGLLKVIFITDGSTDGTAGLINKYPQFKLLHEAQRKGKLSAMNRAIKYADTELVIFSDANGYLNKECIKKLIPHYYDKKVGAVTGEKKILKNKPGDAVGAGEGLYWRYESSLKQLDSDLYTVVGAAGELFSIRRSLYQLLPENIIIEDFVQSLLLCTKGYVVRYEPDAFSTETASPVIEDEMERKIRIAAGGFQAIGKIKQLFNLFKYPVVFFQLVSHRILRWTLSPLCLIIMLLSPVYLYFSGAGIFYGIIAALQIVFYGAGLAGWHYALKNRRIILFYVPFYFFFMNFCIFAGFVRFVSKRQDTIWKKAGRTSKI
jgi:biofilm PGA synthesis N-glycosyltransferase PgaC